MLLEEKIERRLLETESMLGYFWKLVSLMVSVRVSVGDGVVLVLVLLSVQSVMFTTIMI